MLWDWYKRLAWGSGGFKVLYLPGVFGVTVYVLHMYICIYIGDLHFHTNWISSLYTSTFYIPTPPQKIIVYSYIKIKITRCPPRGRPRSSRSKLGW